MLQVLKFLEKVLVLVSDPNACHLHWYLRIVELVHWVFFHLHFHCWCQRNFEMRTHSALDWSEECSVEEDPKHSRSSGLIP